MSDRSSYEATGWGRHAARRTHAGAWNARAVDYATLVLALVLAGTALMPWASAHAPQGDGGFSSVQLGGGPWAAALVFIGGLLVVAVLIATVTGHAMDYVAGGILSLVVLIVSVATAIARADLARTQMQALLSSTQGVPSTALGLGAGVSIAASVLLLTLAARGLYLRRRAAHGSQAGVS